MKKNILKALVTAIYAICLLVILLFPYDKNVYGEDLYDTHQEPFFESATPKECGLDSETINSIGDFVTKKHEGINGVIVLKGDKCVYEKYFNGTDSTNIFETNSVTKTIIGALVGCAIEDGFIDNENTGFTKVMNLSDKCSETMNQITIKDFLTMSSRINWDSVRTSLNMKFKIIKYGKQYYFDLFPAFKLKEEPGSSFEYDTYESRTMMAALTMIVNKEDYEYLMDRMLKDMDVHSIVWPLNQNDIIPGGEDIFLTLRQMAKIGSLYANSGKYYDKQILNSEWVEKSLTSYTDAPCEDAYPKDTLGYGYYWWIMKYGDYTVRFAFGAKGQYIFVIPEENLTMVISSTDKLKGENYRDVFTDCVIKAIRK